MPQIKEEMWIVKFLYSRLFVNFRQPGHNPDQLPQLNI
jgi:hypothetical protein